MPATPASTSPRVLTHRSGVVIHGTIDATPGEISEHCIASTDIFSREIYLRDSVIAGIDPDHPHPEHAFADNLIDHDNGGRVTITEIGKHGRHLYSGLEPGVDVLVTVSYMPFLDDTPILVARSIRLLDDHGLSHTRHENMLSKILTHDLPVVPRVPAWIPYTATTGQPAPAPTDTLGAHITDHEMINAPAITVTGTVAAYTHSEGITREHALRHIHTLDTRVVDPDPDNPMAQEVAHIIDYTRGDLLCVLEPVTKQESTRLPLAVGATVDIDVVYRYNPHYGYSLQATGVRTYDADGNALAGITHQLTNPGTYIRTFDSTPDIPSDFHHHRLWSPRDAATMTESLADFFDNILGTALVAWSRTGDTDPSCFADYHATAQRLAGVYRSPETVTILADEAFLDAVMTMTLAQRAPTGALTPSDIIHTSGVVYLETASALDDLITPLLAEDQAINARFCDPHLPIRAISWCPNPDNPAETAEPVLTLWAEGPLIHHAVADTGNDMPEQLAAYLVPVGVFPLRVLTDGPRQLSPTAVARTDSPENHMHTLAHALMRSIADVSRLDIPEYRTDIPLVPECPPEPDEPDEETISQRRRRLRAHAQRRKDATHVRILQLQHHLGVRADDSDDSATVGGTSRRRLRQHWVTGHWTRQWYSSQQRHKYLYRHGYLRGDARLGVVTGAKVYSATAPLTNKGN